jgi:hypothetical protein
VTAPPACDSTTRALSVQGNSAADESFLTPPTSYLVHYRLLTAEADRNPLPAA